MSLWLLMFQLTEFYCNNFPAIDILMYMYNCYFDEDVSSFAFIPIEEQDKHCLQELAAEQRCIVEHILCTKPLPFRYCCFLFLTTKNVNGFVLLLHSFKLSFLGFTYSRNFTGRFVSLCSLPY